jgi:hypothetical protein
LVQFPKMMRAAHLIFSLFAFSRGLNVAVLGNHNPSAWGTNCTASDAAFTECNLSLFGAAAAQAGDLRADLLVFPEGYSLARLYKGAQFESLVSSVGGAAPCDAPAAAGAPQQAALSCLARAHRFVIAANVFVSLANGSSRIAELVFDPTGAAVSVYFKHHLFPNEVAAGVSAGPFAPTVFPALGRVWGVIICYEGVYPGWEDEYENRDTPLPIFSLAGQPPRLNCVPARVKKAEKALGIRLQSNSTWNFPFFDCYVQVSATVFFWIFEAFMV